MPWTISPNANGATEPRLVSVELRQRTYSGLALIAISLVALFVGGAASALLIGALGVLGMSEWVRMIRPRQLRLIELVCVTILIVLMLVGFYLRPAFAFMLAVVLMLLLFVFAARLDFERAGWLALAVPYIGGGCLAMLYVRLLPDLGFDLMLYLLLVVWGTDIGAYFTGRTLKGPKLLPKVSPSKTWSGLLGGMGLAALLAFIVAAVHDVQQPGLAVALAAVLAVVAQIGDLFESYIKRRCGVKDSGAIIPGHGGVLDRIDGLMFAAAFLALFQTMVGAHSAWW